jgi:hypothetical protein
MMRRAVRRPRLGLSSLETVMATAVTVPVVAFLLVIGVRVIKEFYRVAATLICWPYL